MKNPSFALIIFYLLNLNFSASLYPMIARARACAPCVAMGSRIIPAHAQAGKVSSYTRKQSMHYVPARSLSSHTKSECLETQIVQAKKELNKHDRRFYGSMIATNTATLASIFADLHTAFPILLAGFGAAGVTLMSRIDSLKTEKEIKELTVALEREKLANKGEDEGFPDFFPIPRRK